MVWNLEDCSAAERQRYRAALNALDRFSKLTFAHVLDLLAKADDDPDGDADDAGLDALLPDMPDRPFNVTPKQLQKKYWHAEQFGFSKNYTPERGQRFGDILQSFVNNPINEKRAGTWRGEPAIHYLNRETGMNVTTHPNGEFWTNFILDNDQWNYWPNVK